MPVTTNSFIVGMTMMIFQDMLLAASTSQHRASAKFHRIWQMPRQLQGHWWIIDFADTMGLGAGRAIYYNKNATAPRQRASLHAAAYPGRHLKRCQ